MSQIRTLAGNALSAVPMDLGMELFVERAAIGKSPTSRLLPLLALRSQTIALVDCTPGG